MPLPTIVRMDYKCDISESEKLSLKGRLLGLWGKHQIHLKWFWHLLLMVGRYLVRLWSCGKRQGGPSMWRPECRSEEVQAKCLWTLPAKLETKLIMMMPLWAAFKKPALIIFLYILFIFTSFFLSSFNTNYFENVNL